MSTRADPPLPQAASFRLEQDRDRLVLRAEHLPNYAPIGVDWASDDVRRRIRGGKRQLLARAVGLHKYPRTSIVDATAGLGRDAYVLASLGAELTLLERCEQTAALLADALQRVPDDPAISRMRLFATEAVEWLHAHPATADVVLIDPMYPHSGKQALAKKEMQVLRALSGGDEDADALLPAALACATRRVVVKRPLKAPPLANAAPNFRITGSQARYDIYLPARGSTET
ncbi:MAG: class I SAM-dependent methyltransferase [Gammaproteobacteria bacterium]|nr:class I SAM-dependent methyltransferase [Gammaproteobacteria bacterium]